MFDLFLMTDPGGSGVLWCNGTYGFDLVRFDYTEHTRSSMMEYHS